jgi:hypothetical protein
MTEQKQPYLVFEASYETRAERWYVTESKANAIEQVIDGADNAFPISTEMYNEYKKLEEEIYALKEKLYKLQEPFEDASRDDHSFFNDPEYREAYEFNEMWREAYKMNRQFNCKHDWDHAWGGGSKDECRRCWLSRPCESTQTCARWETEPVEPVEPLAEWEKELLAELDKENK